MAIATASSPFSYNPLAFRPSVSLLPPPKLPFSPILSPSNYHLSAHFENPSFITCHAKSGGSAGEQGDEIEEVFFDDSYLTDYDSDEDDAESSVDLFFRFMLSMFKKISRRAKRASRLILPSVLPPHLVSFAVDGILLLAALAIVKALLEVICTLGSTVFTAILLLRVIWAAVSYFQSNGNTFNPAGNSFGGTQPVA